MNIVPFAFENQQIRIVMDDHGSPWFVAMDVAEVLGYSDAYEMTKKARRR